MKYRIHYSTSTGRSGYQRGADDQELRFDTAEQAQAKIDSWKSPDRIKIGFCTFSYCVEPCQ